MTAFFVPGVEPEQAEARYAELAEQVGADVADPGERIRSVRFVRRTEEWTATVGELLSGRLASSMSRRGAPGRRVADPATVQAVLRVGDAYVVLTDGEPLGPVADTTWDNPFPVPVRDAREVVRFDP